MNKQKFQEWLVLERGKREWSQSDLSRQSGLHRAVISKLESGTQPMPETLNALADAFGYPREYVYEVAGYLSPKPDLSLIKRLLIHVAQDLPDSDIELAIAMLEKRAEYYRQNPQAKPAK